jgi:DnaJ-domain-containing protein 1
LLWSERKNVRHGTRWLCATSVALVAMWFLGGLALFLTAYSRNPNSRIPPSVLLVVSCALLTPLLKAASGRVRATALGKTAVRAAGPIRDEAIAEWPDLLRLATRLRTQASEIGVTSLADPSIELAKFVASNSEAVLADSQTVQDYARGMRRAIEKDLQLFDKAASVHRRNSELLKKVSAAMLAARRPSLLDMLDELIQRHEQSPDALRQGAWDKYFEEADQIKVDLEDLMHHTQHGSGNGNEEASRNRDHAAATDPHTVLGVSRGASPEQIKAVYQRLANIWHPDKGLVHDDARFKEIDAAYRKICGR